MSTLQGSGIELLPTSKKHLVFHWQKKQFSAMLKLYQFNTQPTEDGNCIAPAYWRWRSVPQPTEEGTNVSQRYKFWI